MAAQQARHRLVELVRQRRESRDAGIDAQIRSLRTEIDQARRSARMAALWHKLKAETIYVPLHNQTITHAMREGFDIPIDVSSQPKMKYVAAPTR